MFISGRPICSGVYMAKLPCPHCRLLIDEVEPTCPFCGKAVTGISPPARPRARVVPRTGQSTSTHMGPLSVTGTPNSARSNGHQPPRHGGVASRRLQRALAWGSNRWPIVCGAFIGLIFVGGLLLGLGDGGTVDAPTAENTTPVSPETDVAEVPSTTSRPSSSTTIAPNGAEDADESPTEERSVVMIRVFEGDVECRGASGVVFPTSEYIITNDHVVSADEECAPDEFEIWLTTDGSRSVRYGYEAELVGSDVLSDLGILRVIGTKASIKELVPLEGADDQNIGNEILLYGFPGIAGDSLTVSKGIVSGFINQDGSSWIKTDAAASGGSSGGPAVTRGRKLVGVVSQAGSSSNGEIVDCRLVADTNGDGFIDEEDTCVPIGSEFTLLVPLEKILRLLETVIP